MGGARHTYGTITITKGDLIALDALSAVMGGDSWLENFYNVNSLFGDLNENLGGTQPTNYTIDTVPFGDTITNFRPVQNQPFINGDSNYYWIDTNFHK